MSELGTSEEGVITKVYGHGSFRKRITEMGFVRGKTVKVIRNAPLRDPVEYQIMGYHIALRRSEAHLIEVAPLPGRPSGRERGDGTLECRGEERTSVPHRLRYEGAEGGAGVIDVALVGNPNSGKTSLFNVASGSHEKVGNYAGVTVGSKNVMVRHKGNMINLFDLPGTYSVTEYTPEELYVRTHLLEQMPDVVVNVIDASNLERNLFLTTQLIDMDLKVVIALNMYDELEEAGARLDYDMLGAMIGIPMVPTVASRGRGIDSLFDKIVEVFEDKDPTVRHVHINYGVDVERSIKVLQDLIWRNSEIVARYSSRYLSIKLLEGDRSTLEAISAAPNIEQIEQAAADEQAQIEKLYGERTETVIADARYGFIAGALAETYGEGTVGEKGQRSSRIDRVLTHKFFGIPIFLGILWLMFQATFSLGNIPAGWIEQGVGWLGGVIAGAMAEGPLRDLLCDGVINGVGGVLMFLPNILLLFLFISIMEDTGYMARAAFIMDKAMHRIGLHGKSFIPLLMGFGCNVPAIMATRTLESRKDRILTILIIPFMSCSARMPVYVLLVSAFFVHWQGAVLLSIYLAGVLVAIVSSLALRKIFFSKKDAPFVMELPPYRIPTTRSVIRHMWGNGVQYLRKMGSVILVAAVLIWALGYFPRKVDYSKDYAALHSQVEASLLTPEERQQQLHQLDVEQASERQAASYIGRLGRAIEPAIRPLGFDWHIGISLLSGMAAKEIIVSSMAVLSNTGDDAGSLARQLRNQKYISGPRAGESVYSPLVAYALMIFILLYFPCFAAIAAVRKEIGGRWALFTVLYTTAIAWIAAFAVYQTGMLL
ncbi:ferrous iron transport protein B [Bacteroidia bacterium]|nr:ferrous iron transport protein B [Bacteroidia bacterium]